MTETREKLNARAVIEMAAEIGELRAENQHIRDGARREALEEAAKVAEMLIPTLIPTHEPLRMLRVMIAAGIRDLAELQPETCTKCDGCGEVADTEDQEPWTLWDALPEICRSAMTLGIVRAMTCPACKGTGKKGGD